MTFAWLRRILHRPSIEDCLRAASKAPCEPLRAPDAISGPMLAIRALNGRAAHYEGLGEDPNADWGPFDNPFPATEQEEA